MSMYSLSDDDHQEMMSSDEGEYDVYTPESITVPYLEDIGNDVKEYIDYLQVTIHDLQTKITSMNSYIDEITFQCDDSLNRMLNLQESLNEQNKELEFYREYQPLKNKFNNSKKNPGNMRTVNINTKKDIVRPKTHKKQDSIKEHTSASNIERKPKHTKTDSKPKHVTETTKAKAENNKVLNKVNQNEEWSTRFSEDRYTSDSSSSSELADVMRQVSPVENVLQVGKGESKYEPNTTKIKHRKPADLIIKENQLILPKVKSKSTKMIEKSHQKDQPLTKQTFSLPKIKSTSKPSQQQPRKMLKTVTLPILVKPPVASQTTHSLIEKPKTRLPSIFKPKPPPTVKKNNHRPFTAKNKNISSIWDEQND